MDPLSALSVAGSIVQFIEFGSKLLSQGLESYKSASGSLKVDEELSLVITDLKVLIQNIRKGPSSFESIRKEAVSLAEVLLARLEAQKVRRHNHSSALGSFRQVVKRAWSQRELDELVQRLKRLKESMETRVLFTLQEDLSAQSQQMSSHLSKLNQQSELIVDSLVDCGRDLKASRMLTENLTSTITNLITRLGVTTNHTPPLFCGGTKHEQVLKGPDSYQSVLSAPQDINDEIRELVHSRIIQSLRYPSMSNRYESLGEAHPDTFNWVFEGSRQSDVSSNNLGNWFKFGTGLYWVSGKPGSGKSTLMKYVFDDSRTLSYLREWSGDLPGSCTPLCLASFFFWNSGTPEQKSQSGMLRSILFQVLEQYPDLTPILLPTICKNHYSRAIKNPTIFTPVEWSLRQLMSAFEILMGQETIHINLCLLIDGLDEFDGDQEEITATFERFAKNRPSSIKVCLSSRPWAIFQDSFSNCPTLKLQNLTYRDISIYVKDKFLRNDGFRRLSQKDQSAAGLISEIVTKADGVFLWVHLVVKDVLRGIRNLDNMSQLRRRINAMPRDLEPLFEHLISQIDTSYLAWASKAFQIERAARELAGDNFLPRSNGYLSVDGINTSDDLIHSCHGTGSDLEELQPYGTLESQNGIIGIMDEDFIRAEISRVSRNGSISALEFYEALEEGTIYDEMINRKCLPYTKCVDIFQELDIHLSSRCALLLEIELDPHSQRPGPDNCVRYLHRTARDFMESQSRWEWVISQTEALNFSPHLSLMWSYSYNIYRLCSHSGKITDDIDCGNLYGWASKAVIQATHVQGCPAQHDTCFYLLNQMDALLTGRTNLGEAWYTFLDIEIICYSNDRDQITCFMDFASRLNLQEYKDIKTKNTGKENVSGSLALTSLATRQLEQFISERPFHLGPPFRTKILTFPMACKLIALGADLRSEYQNAGYPIWYHFLKYGVSGLSQPLPGKLEYMRTMKLLISRLSPELMEIECDQIIQAQRFVSECLKKMARRS